ncbi:hypothetical protein CFP56_040192 [Quercus suber]|uniref:Uncharacterized protein n=1 Tax=Quercus suber TaxID=58331 RepID=A0AAW0IZ30_QUESU
MAAHCLFRLGTSSKRHRVGSLSPTLSSPTTLSSTSTPSSNWYQLSRRGGPRPQLVIHFSLQFQSQLGQNVRLLCIV